MPKVIPLLIALALFLSIPSTLWGASSHLPLEGGIANEYDYEEFIYITGQPILMKGKVTVNISAGRGDSTTTRFTYTLTDVTGQNKLSRSATYVEESRTREDSAQSVHYSQLDRITETITIDGVRYQLVDGQLSKAVTKDKHPVVNYYGGNWEGRKIYTVNRDVGRLTVEISGHTVGYDHNWGRSETQRMTQILQYTPVNVPQNAQNGPLATAWDGQIDYAINLSTDRHVSYHGNDPVNISFSGGYLISEQGSSTALARYNLPWVSGQGADRQITNEYRNRNEQQLSLQTVPKLHRLYVPNYADIRGHWSESYVNRLAGIKAWNGYDGYFGPTQPITRLDFARAFVQALGVVSPEGPSGMIAYTAGYPNLPAPGEKAKPQNATRPSARAPYDGATGTPRQRNAAIANNPSPFADVTPAMEGFDEVRLAHAQNIMAGVSYTRFDPYGLMTREQAATLIVRGLGLANLAPSGYTPSFFYDDHQISNWARDSIYVAQELGILTGDSYGNFRPQEPLTRAEAAAVLVQAIEFLQYDLKQDYRDRLFNMF
ncbi:S-layer homology domain-containing protein [Heliorestis acidaminivorans]|uniref:S-layer homology domain-containing protein n=1 Tax=Heliorestis acidaminivorans TaxID=553427 RepID=A0A6I0F8G5_9FIRM|nr:S-layer homology domain-containing protein [Heliorestis acidaminivorans]KAB2953788.1 S-layer homology domain-containing protein [Heliorestis acidaminivorans]